MKFNTSDPDIETIIRRIDRNIIDLQPNFQRGEVWSTPKKQRLIDTILRGWHVPPIHLVAKDDATFDVLDGQQRLTAIRDFIKGNFAVNGNIEPNEEFLNQIHGIRYGNLPPTIKNKFDQYSIRVFELTDYKPSEPYELFFRLNQPISLTEAEKRNAFIGNARNQVKELVDWAEGSGMTSERIGFSNARMSYDDLLGRFLLTLEQHTLREKVTASKITARYRMKEPFPDDVMAVAKESLKFFLDLPMLDNQETRGKPNKATILTWLCMAAKLIREDSFDLLKFKLADTISAIERQRFMKGQNTEGESKTLITIFHDRATARVGDVTSVLLRDLCGWMFFVQDEGIFIQNVGFLETASAALAVIRSAETTERELLGLANSNGWGGPGWL